MNPGQAVSFSGNSLQTANILTDKIDHNGFPEKDAKLYALAHANQSNTPFVNYPTKTIPVTGTIFGSSIADLDSRIDAFKSYLAGTEQNLDIAWNGSTRRYIATANKLAIDRPYGLTYGKFSLEFDCKYPFGNDTATTTALTASGRTSAVYNDSYTFLGTGIVQQPITTVTLTAVTGGTNQYISWGNGNTGQAITVSRTWSNGDVLVIDSTQSTVTVNGLPVNFSGAFSQFAVGAGTLQYYDGFATRTFSITTIYTARYL